VFAQLNAKEIIAQHDEESKVEKFSTSVIQRTSFGVSFGILHSSSNQPLPFISSYLLLNVLLIVLFVYASGDGIQEEEFYEEGLKRNGIVFL
jgi:hypothetical protein